MKDVAISQKFKRNYLERLREDQAAVGSQRSQRKRSPLRRSRNSARAVASKLYSSLPEPCPILITQSKIQPKIGVAKHQIMTTLGVKRAGTTQDSMTQSSFQPHLRGVTSNHKFYDGQKNTTLTTDQLQLLMLPPNQEVFHMKIAEPTLRFERSKIVYEGSDSKQGSNAVSARRNLAKGSKYTSLAMNDDLVIVDPSLGVPKHLSPQKSKRQ